MNFEQYPTELPAGIDEAGRGALAGPVVSAAVVFKEGFDIIGLEDSKKLTPKERNELSIEIKEFALAYGIGYAWQRQIDKVNILQATLISMARAVQSLTLSFKKYPSLLYIDGLQTIPEVYFKLFAKDVITLPKQKAIVEGDSLVPVISAASVLAKVQRDALMTKLSQRYPDYNFAKHMGYGSKEHREALKKYGASSLHRFTFKGVLPPQEQASFFD